MSLDTRDQRASALLGRGGMPFPDGSIDALDRPHALGLYRLALEAAPVETLTLPEMVHAAILEERTAAGFTFNDFGLALASLPIQDREDFIAANPTGRVYVRGAARGLETAAARRRTVLREFAVQVHYEHGDVDGQDADAVDELVALVEEMAQVCRAGFDGYQWVRTDMIDDPSGTPFDFGLLRQGVFYAYFTAVYRRAD